MATPKCQYLCAIICTKLWLRINSFIHEKKFDAPKLLMRSAIQQLEFFQDSSSRVTSVTPPQNSDRRQDLKWLNPQAPLIKSNWDAAVDRSSQSIGLGGIIKDSTGAVLAAFCSKIPALVQPKIAEACALKKSISICWEWNLLNIVFEGDCQTVVQAVYRSKDCAD